MSKQGLWELEWILWGFTVLSGGVNTPARVCLAAVETLTTFHTFKTLEKQAGVKCAAHTSYLASRFLYQGVFKYSSLQIGQDLKMKILVPVSKENINSITVYFLREVKRFLWSNCILLWSVETWCLSMSMCILFPVCTCVNSIVKYNLCSLGWEETSFFLIICLKRQALSLLTSYLLAYLSLIVELILASDTQFSYSSLLNAGIIGTYQPHLACRAIFLLFPPLHCPPLLSSSSLSSFFDNILLCSQDWLWTHYVAQSRWTLRNLPASVSWVVPCCLTKATNSWDLSLPSWELHWG